MAAQEVPLWSLSLGMWSTGRHTGLELLVMPRSQLLVFLVDAAGGSRSLASKLPAGSRSLASKLPAGLSSPGRPLAVLGARSPFNPAHLGRTCTIAFEVDLASVVGIDYTNELCRPGRVVLEALQVRKREFRTVSFVRAGRTVQRPRCPPRSRHAAADCA